MNNETPSTGTSDSARGLRGEGRSSAGWILPLIIAAAAFVPFWPALSNNLVNWDDDLYLIGHTQWRGLSWEHIRWMFTTTRGGPYQPLGWLSWAVDDAIWGMKPRGFHLTSMLLHAANAVVFYLIALAVLERAVAPKARGAVRAGAVAAALLFAVHPLRVESVVWATERRDVLSGLFYLLSVLAYLRWWARSAEGSAGRARGWPQGAFLFFVLALFSKGMSVTLPVVLLVLDAYPLRRIRFRAEPGTPWFTGDTRRAVLEKIPFLAASLIMGLVALYGVHAVGALTVERVGLVPRLAVSCYSVCFYLLKSVWPANLSPLYEMPLAFNPWEWRYVASAVVFVLVCTFVYWKRSSWPWLAAAWVCYLVVLAPVSGLLHAGPQIAADRYTYLSTLSLALLVGGAVCHVWSWGGWRRPGVTLAGGAAVVTLGVLTVRQSLVWRDSQTLWEHALRVDPGSWNARHYLGVTMAQLNRLDEAVHLYEQALEANPGCARIYYNLGMARYQRGELDRAVKRFGEALRLQPNYPEVHYNLATLLTRRGMLNEAVQHYEEAIRQRPGYPDALVNLGTTLLRMGRIDEALERYHEVLRADPGNVPAQINVAHALYAQGHVDEAVRRLRRLVQASPASVQARYTLGLILAEQGRLEEAAAEGRAALQINPKRQDIQRWLQSLPPAGE